ncbi:4-hydroxy-tetrahydrodipicolinate synthase [Leeia sp. TBRC 13508]|uniref:4-hydroxy-tetrahydrodipicolinate synthase n=1 Tax=Leeia speluncae TaxID=2884804 RepID=A0ABS8D1C2_9NEIS|nr:4-hydroxy-tetrahydrodipicolinate synthase [Leeia speluncae]MCB6181989.1 4-hydroxy-tetrahydrodipicolinate synthase [Leeia speluncae]
MLTGSLVAIVTPMHEDGSLDFEAFRQLIEFHIEQKSDGLVVVGTTGESPTVTVEEHIELIRFAVEHAKGRLPIIAGTGANSTHEAIALTKAAKSAGASACLSVVPYYNKPTQEGLYQHFKAIVEAVDIPVILYNVPGRTVADLHNDTVVRLAQLPNIIGIKDATADLARATDLIARVPETFAMYTGDDATALPFMLLGGHGVISVTANVAPKAMHDLCVAARSGNIAEARRINDGLFGLHTKLFVEANPIPVKWAAAELGLMKHGIRLPLTPLTEAGQAAVQSAIAKAGELIVKP